MPRGQHRYGHTISNMRDVETVESELRLLAAVRRACLRYDGGVPSIEPVDARLDELLELAQLAD